MSNLAASLTRVRDAYARLLRLCGLLAGLTTFAMMVLVVANAVLRFALNAPITGTLEITEVMLCLLIFLSLALTQYEGGHIHVTLLTKRLAPGVQRLLGVAAMLLGLVFFGWSTWASWDFAMKSLAMNEQEWGAIQIPLYPVKFVLFAGLAMLAIQFLLDAAAVALGLPVAGQRQTDSQPEAQ